MHQRAELARSVVLHPPSLLQQVLLSPGSAAPAFDARQLALREISAPSDAVMRYSSTELAARRFQFGSTLSVLDRLKFEREFDVASLHLSPADLLVWQHNPHVRQVLANRRPLQRAGRPLLPSDRMLHEASPRTPYARRIGEAKTVDHWGQRKLLLSEIEFLTHYAREGDVVLYAGAAPGNHVRFLAENMFPRLRFILVDPARFECLPTEHIQIRNVRDTHHTYTPRHSSHSHMHIHTRPSRYVQE